MPEIALLNPLRRLVGIGTFERALMLDTEELKYRLVRASRRTVAIHVGAAGVEVRAPRWASLADIEGFMRQKARWIRRRMADAQHHASAIEAFRWEDGARLPILGREVRLVASPGLRGIFHRDDELLIGHAPRQARLQPGADASTVQMQDWRRRVTAWLREQALEHYAIRVAQYADALAVPVPALKLSNAATQWGSCIRRPAHQGGVRVLLHWKLYLMPQHLVDYVVAHELAHIRELNHSPRFWAEVERVYPDPVTARRDLNRLGRTLPRL